MSFPSKKKQAPPLARQIILVFAFFCKGTRSQEVSDYTINVPFSVSVQHGFAVHISCQFTYSGQGRYRNNNIFAYWFRVDEQNRKCSRLYFPTCDHLVATNHKSRPVESSAKDRFYLIGDPTQGNCSLIILNAQMEDQGRYYLRIEGNNNIANSKFSFIRPGVDTSPYVFVIEPPHDITIMAAIEKPGSKGSFFQRRKTEHDPLVVQEGDTVQLFCTAKGRPNPTIIWMNEKTSQDTNNYVYTLYQVGPEDAEEYRCEAKNQLGSIQATAQMIVQYQPRAVNFSISQTHKRGPTPTQVTGCPRDLSNGSHLLVQEGDSLRLLCQADSNPPVNTSWVKVDRPLEVLPDNWLELNNLTIEDEGEYTCNASNSLGIVQGIVRLNVAYAPKLSKNAQKNTTCWNEETGFLCSCALQAQPPPQIEWELDGNKITENSGKSGNVMVVTLVQENEVTSTLNWTGGLDKAHRIVCSGSNSFGVQAVQFFLDTLRDPASKSSTGTTVFLISGLCGIFLGVGIFMLFLFLMKVRKQKEALSKTDSVEGTVSASQRAHHPSQIYSNIFPAGGPRPPLTGQLNTPAGGRKLTPAPVSGVPSPRKADPDELQYAALKFKPKCENVPVSCDGYVEYSTIQRK